MARMPAAPRASLGEAFRGLYYYLYANGQASRAERIVEDMTLALLAKLAVERTASMRTYDEVLDGASPDVLLDLVAAQFPGAIRPEERFNNDAAAVRDALRALRDVELSDAPAHVVGEAFQAVVGPRVRGEKGQFFTPRSLVAAMVAIVDPQPGEKVVDPAAGSGGFLVEAHAHAAGRGGAATVVGGDKDFDLFRLQTALLAMVAGDDAHPHHQNSLDLDAWSHVAAGGLGTYDVVLANPPFGARIGVEDQALLGRYDLAHVWSRDPRTGGWRRTDTVDRSRDPQILFLELCVRLLRPGGRMGIVLPEGVFGNAGSAYVWEWLRTQGAIEALLDCPRTTFQPGTDTKTNVLFFRKDAPQGPTWVASALHCGHDRRGRRVDASGRSVADDFPALAAEHAQRGTDGSRWQQADLTDATYLVPRYFERPAPRTPQEARLVEGARWVSLGDLVHDGALTVRKGHEPGSDAYGTGDVPFVRTSDVANFEVSTDPTKSVSEEVWARYRDSQALRPGDLLMVVDGRYRIGTAAMVTQRTVRSVIQSHLRILSVTPGTPDLDPYALLYALTLPSVRLRVRDLVFVQSTLGTLGARLFELEVPLLGGDGPWRGSVEAFRRVLDGRDALLTELERATAGETFEL
ncbi:N-6 DNA methylase [Cellulomonas fimi ATCC 484]|uniref:N-6 DNA methylase n=2 Tax=Cellulomonas fimi TaxID=1708 RepID=F4GZG9_CELFA|nr:N-6 DNA methylase [Cellulomonas fimi ATCC 484]VEH27592.1 Probable type I restriction enzyme BthVORF4518P M protein [Cellulomonas fimi]